MKVFIAILLTAVLGLALVTTPANARTTLMGADGPTQTRYQSWIDQALVPTADVTVQLHLADCPESLGGPGWCMNPKTLSLWTEADFDYLFTNPAFSEDERDRVNTRLNVLHEVGHVFDFEPGFRNGFKFATQPHKGYRRVFAHIMSYRRGWNWYDAKDAKGHWITPYEQFAMAYAFCAVYPHWHDADYARTVWWGYDYEPTPLQYERVCRLLRNPAAPWAHIA